MADFYRLSQGFYRRLDKMLDDRDMWHLAVELSSAADPSDKWQTRLIEKKLTRPLGFAEVFTKSGKTAKVPIFICYSLKPRNGGVFEQGAKRIVISVNGYFQTNPKIEGVLAVGRYRAKFNSTLTHELSHARDCLFDPHCEAEGVFLRVKYPRGGGEFDMQAAEAGDDEERKKAILYFNHPTELRSFSKEIAQEVMARLGRRTPRLITKKTFALGRCSGETIKRAIHVTPVFLQISPFLSEGSLASLYRHVGREVFLYLTSKNLCD